MNGANFILGRWREFSAHARALLGFAAILSHGPAAAQAHSSLPADRRAQWGLLADMADRDFEAVFRGARALDLFRWRIVGQILEEHEIDVRSLAEHRYTYTLDPATAIISVRDSWNPLAHYQTRTAPDGTFVDLEGRPIIARDDGGYAGLGRNRIGDANNVYRPIAEGTERTRAALARLIQRAPQLASPIRDTDQQLASEGARPVEARPDAPATLAHNFPNSRPASAESAASRPATAPAIIAARASGPRVALVVGISSYGTLGNLPNPGNDARALRDALQRVGFNVELLVDPDLRALRAGIQRLGERMGSAGRGATGLFFFAGHGIQSRGVNYLIPARANIQREADLELEAVPADAVLAQMQESPSSTNIVILDACRNMPLTRSFRSGGSGLVRMDAPNGSFIAYSTAPGSVAADGNGANSPFAAALVSEMAHPGEPIEIVFRNVRRAVLNATDGQQTPWDSSSLLDGFYFVPEEARANNLSSPDGR